MFQTTQIKKILPLLVFCFYSVNVKADTFTSSSVLSGGKWFKIAITEDGIYKIEFSKLKQLGLENPSNPKIFGNNCGQLSYYNDGSAPDDLKEIAVHTSTGGDGVFNEGDFMLFYAQGTNRWIYNEPSGKYTFLRHNYSDTAFYFLTSGSEPGKRIGSAQVPDKSPDNLSSESDIMYIHEVENENLIHSGREWYQPISFSRDIEINPGFNDINLSESVKYTVRVLARAGVTTSFRLTENGSVICNIPVTGINLASTTGTYAQTASTEGEFFLDSADPVYKLTYFNNNELSARGWIDYLILQARKFNKFDGNTTYFRDPKSTGTSIITEFTIDCSSEELVIWDVTDNYNTSNIDYKREGNIVTFKALHDTIRTFIAFEYDKAKIPVVRPGSIPNQNIHSSDPADMIIVTSPVFLPYAEKLSEIHRENSGLLSLVVTSDQIYNEFSGGIPDIAAIRNFLRMKFLIQKNGPHPLKYLLLFGDGSYNNKIPPPGNTNYLPTYQSQISNIMVSSYTSDDFFGLLEDSEGEDVGSEDIGIGRLPVSDTVEAGVVVSKIEKYLNSSDQAEWKNMICLTADDEDWNTHISDAELLAELLKENAPWLNIEKIYFDAFDQITTPTGQFYPDVTKTIDDRINAGTLIFNYIGHANETSLGHERVLTPDNIQKWTNLSKLPLFITATCEFSRFDDIYINTLTGELSEKYSTGEKILLHKNGGAIALMSATRLAYSASNFSINRNILLSAFKPDEEGSAPRLGDIIKSAKNLMGSNTNKRSFVLLGDPAVRLSWPWHGKVMTDSINSVHIAESADTLKAMSLVSIAGHIEDNYGNYLSDFDGTLNHLVFGKASEVNTLANDGGPAFTFETQTNIMFSGMNRVENGRFRFSFMVPRDIDYSYGNAKISYYAFDEKRDMTGWLSNLITGGFSNTDEVDTTGPDIKLYFNDTLFHSGGITGPNPKLLALIEDKSGINTTGTAIGHDIIYWLDDNQSQSYVLNNYYKNDFGYYNKGRIFYNLSDLNPGHHKLTLKAWDNFNNSTEKSILFNVSTENRLILSNLINYPNPFSSETRISAGHNRPGEELNITLTIYSLNGAVIKIIRTSFLSAGYQIMPLVWDGTNSGGTKTGSGMYLYKMELTTEKGETGTISGKMIIY